MTTPRQSRMSWACGVLIVATVVQLLVAVLVPELPQFRGKAFTARLVAYPVLMLALPVALRLTHRLDTRGWTASALVMAPFLVDVTGNTLDLYDRLMWWDDWCHFMNWALLMSGLGLLLDPDGRAPRLVRALAIAGLGSMIAIVWELGEWSTFIRFGTELAHAYTDTLGDLCLGSLGGIVGAGYALRSTRHS